MPKSEEWDNLRKINVAPVPECFNQAIGDGNCEGMVKNDTCPVIAAGTKGRFPLCMSFVFEKGKEVGARRKISTLVVAE